MKKVQNIIHGTVIAIITVVSAICMTCASCYADTATVPVTLTLPASDIVMFVPETPQTSDDRMIYPYILWMGTAFLIMVITRSQNKKKYVGRV